MQFWPISYSDILSFAGLILSVIGIVITLVGFRITWVAANDSKRAAMTASENVARLSHRIKVVNTAMSLKEACAIIDEITRITSDPTETLLYRLSDLKKIIIVSKSRPELYSEETIQLFGSILTKISGIEDLMRKSGNKLKAANKNFRSLQTGLSGDHGFLLAEAEKMTGDAIHEG